MSLPTSEKDSDKLLGNKREPDSILVIPDKKDSTLHNANEPSFMSENNDKDIPTEEKDRPFIVDTQNKINQPTISCHICKTTDNPFSLLTCINSHCQQSFCCPCAKKILFTNKESYRKLKKNADERNNWVCFICKEICTCSFCGFMAQQNSNIRVDKKEEEKAETIQDIQKCPSDTITFNLEMGNPEMFENKMVEKKRCAVCGKSDIDLIGFKAIEDFLNYMKNAFEKKQGFIKNEPLYEQNRVTFFEMYPLLFKIVGTAFKEMKYMCKICLVGKLNEVDGFKSLYKLLELEEIIQLANLSQTEEPFIVDSLQSRKDKDMEKEIDKAKILIANLEPLPNQNTTQKREDSFIHNQMSDKIEKEKSLDQCKNFENSLNFLTGQEGTSKTNTWPLESLLQGTLNAQKTMSNFPKIPESMTNFYNQNMQTNLNMLSNISQLNGFLSSMFNDQNIQSNTLGEFPKAGNEEEKKDENMNNVTNIIMNFDQNKNNPLVAYMVGILDDLKKQINSIQYYSQMQKFFIAYIFKNLEVFMGQVSDNQILNDCQKSILSSGFLPMHGGLGLPQMSQLNQMNQSMMGMNLPQPGLSVHDINLFKKMTTEENKQLPSDMFKPPQNSIPSNCKLEQNIYGSGDFTTLSGSIPQTTQIGGFNQINQMSQMGQPNSVNISNILLEQWIKGKIGASSQSGMTPQSVGNINSFNLLGLLSNCNQIPTINSSMPGPLLMAKQGHCNITGGLGGNPVMQGQNLGGMMGLQNILSQQLGMPNTNLNYFPQNCMFTNQSQLSQFSNSSGSGNQNLLHPKKNLQDTGYNCMTGKNLQNFLNLFSNHPNENTLGPNGMQSIYNSNDVERKEDKVKQMGTSESSLGMQEYMLKGNIGGMGNLGSLREDSLMQLQMFLSKVGNIQNKPNDKESDNN